MGSCFPFLSKEDNAHKLDVLFHIHFNPLTQEHLLISAWRQKKEPQKNSKTRTMRIEPNARIEPGIE